MRTHRLAAPAFTLALFVAACAAPTDGDEETLGTSQSELNKVIVNGVVKSVTVTSDQMSSSLTLALAGTRFQVDTQGNGPTLTGTPYLAPAGPLPAYKLEQLGCLDDPDSARCLALLGNRPGHWVTPTFHSYVKWGPVLHALEPTLQDKPLYVPVFEKDIAGPGGVRVKVNNLNVVFGPQTFSAGIAQGKVYADLSLTSNSPTLVCEHTEWYLGCPDVRLTNMKLHVDLSNFVPSADAKSLEYSAANVDFSTNVDVNNVPDGLLGLFVDVQGAIQNAVESKLRSKLLDADAKKAIGAAVMKLVEQQIPAADKPIAKVLSAQVVGDKLVVSYRTQGLIALPPGGPVLEKNP